MRDLLHKFDTTVFAFPETIEVTGLIPMKHIRVPVEATNRKRGSRV